MQTWVRFNYPSRSLFASGQTRSGRRESGREREIEREREREKERKRERVKLKKNTERT